MQDRIEAMRKEMAKIRKEKEVLEIKSCIQEQRLKRRSEELTERGLDAENGWGLVGEYLNSLTLANQYEKCLSKKINELMSKRDQLKFNVEGQRLVVKHHYKKKKEWIKTCEDMTNCVQHHATSLAIQVWEVNEEIKSNLGIKLPWSIFKLLKYCQNLSKSLV